MATYKNRDLIEHALEHQKKLYPINFICGWWGNIEVETMHTFDPAIVQRSAGISNEQYLQEVMSGQRDFDNDHKGYGLCQWTSPGRKTGLHNFCTSHGYMLNSLEGQLAWMDIEIQSTGYADCRKAINQNWSVEECARIICTQYERPASMQADEKTKEAAIQKRIANAIAFKQEFFPDVKEEPIMSNGVKICLDAGHYGKYNRSPVVLAYYESDFTWNFTNYEKAQLEARGFEVILTRQDKAKDLALDRRGKMSKGCQLFISNHSNACGTESVDRPVGIIPIPFTGTDVDGCNTLANLITANIHNMMKTKQVGKVYSKDAGYDRNANRKLNDDEYYGVLNGAQSVHTPMYMIIEHSFHTNKKAATWLLVDANVKALAVAEANIIADYLEAKLKLVPEKPQTEPEPIPKDPVPTVSYVVVAGDTLSGIAAKFGVSIEDIMTLNPIIKNPNVISKGWKLTIPATSKRQEFYKVKANDHLSKIAAEYRKKGYSVKWQDIAKANGISIPYTIREGQSLYIPI